MIRSNLLTLFAILTLVSFSGCWDERTIEVPKPYSVPVKCKVPDTVCKVEGSDTEVILGLLECIVDYERNSEVCK